MSNEWGRMVGVFGRENLWRLSPQPAAGLQIPQRSREFLAGVGLPTTGVLLLSFDLAGDALPTLAEYGQQRGRWVDGGQTKRRLGSDYRLEICLDESRGGCVVAVDLEGKIPEQFVNSSVEAFAEFLALYEGDYGGLQHASDRKCEATAGEIEQKMRAIDPAALSDPHNWWAGVLEQMKDGLL